MPLSAFPRRARAAKSLAAEAAAMESTRMTETKPGDMDGSGDDHLENLVEGEVSSPISPRYSG